MNIETANQHLIINQIKNSAQDPVKIKKQYINLEKEKKMKTKLTKEYLQEVSNKIHNNTYLIISDYVRCNALIEIIHLTCGTKFKTRFNNHKKGRGCCSKCFLSVKKTKEQLQQESNKIHNNEYEIIGDYINTDTKIEIKHKICGGIFTQTPDKHLRHNKCPICHGKTPLNIYILQSRSDKKYNGEYTIIGEYVNVATPILIRHNICGTEYLQIPNNHLRRKCFNCYGTPKRTNNQFQIESDKLHKSEYTLISDYKDANTPVYMKHKKCGKVFDIIPYSHIKYLSKCKYCYNSKGENKISDFLDELKIKYVKGTSLLKN